MTRETRTITAAALSYFILGIGVISLAGIVSEHATLASWIPGSVPMALSTAVSTIATGLTLLLLTNERSKPKH